MLTNFFKRFCYKDRQRERVAAGEGRVICKVSFKKEHQ